VTLLVVDELCKTFGGVVAARHVSFTLDRGDMVAIIGPNGAGKSTVFNMVGGQLKAGIGRTFQVAQTFPSMTVSENVQMALISHKGEALGLWRAARERHRDEALHLLEQVGMSEFANRAASTLAYGDVKRVELAIALGSRPRLLLMDEPTAGMAPRERSALMDLTESIASSQQIGVLFTEHDMDVVFGHARRVLVLMRGEVIAAGTPDEVRRDRRVQDAYLGDAHALRSAS
jgi:branched-chain amino acid transport system ATP-binding protein